MTRGSSRRRLATSTDAVEAAERRSARATRAHDDGDRSDGIFEPGRNCWRVERAERFHCVQDGALYFRLVREAILSAQRSIFILGWDIAAGVDLVPDAADDGAPRHLAELLDFVVRRRRGLHAYVLIWDYAAVYALERDPFSRMKLGWSTHRRVHFRFDDQHPYGASHHQKIVVIDDRLAFSGGLDLTGHRWDTADHLPEHPLRTNIRGQPYTPFHDVQALVEGPIAAALGALARERWRRGGWRGVRDGVPARESLWPADLTPDLTDVDVAIARTEPSFRRRSAVRECERLFYDSIAAARRTIYIENQYFTNRRLGEALAARLREPDGPELVVLGPKECSGWLEQKTMGALRHEVLTTLIRADLHDRLRLYIPTASRARDVSTFVHSKVMVIDDELLRIGSANLSNRSMGMDTECDVAVEARGDPDIRAGIARVRDRLLAEHLSASADEIGRAVERTGSLRAAIDELAVGDHTLVSIEVEPTQGPEPSPALRMAADPDEPMRVTRTFDRLLPEFAAHDARFDRMTLALPLGALLVTWLVLARSADLGHWVRLAGMQEILTSARVTPEIALGALAIFVAAGLVFVPLELLVLATVVVFGPLLGSVLAFAGALGAAAAGYVVGRALGPTRLFHWIGPRAAHLWPQLDERGGVSVALLRLVPIASATTIHLLCGAARVRARAYFGGTAIGLLPGIATLCVVGGLLRRAIYEPSVANSAVAAGAALALAFLALHLRRSLLEKQLGAAVEEQSERARFG